MGTPSVSNICRLSEATVWTPPTTDWHLDTESVTTLGAFYGDHSSLVLQNQFDSLLGRIIPADTGLFSASDLQAYDYFFLGVNGGSDETVHGKTAFSGIIVTDDRKDTVFGDEQGDLIFSGNGVDTVHGGAGGDHIFGENGPDHLYGDAGNDAIFGGNDPDTIVGGADTGTLSYAHTDGTLSMKSGVTHYNGNLESLPCDTHSAANPLDKVHNTHQFFIENGQLYDVFDSRLIDVTLTSDNTLSTDGHHRRVQWWGW